MSPTNKGNGEKLLKDTYFSIIDSSISLHMGHIRTSFEVLKTVGIQNQNSIF